MFASAFQGDVSEPQRRPVNTEQGGHIGSSAEGEAAGAAFEAIVAGAEALWWRVQKRPFEADRACLRITEGRSESDEIVPRITSGLFEGVAKGQSGRVARRVVQPIDDKLVRRARGCARRCAGRPLAGRKGRPPE